MTREEIEKFIEEKVPKREALPILLLLDIKELLEKLVKNEK